MRVLQFAFPGGEDNTHRPEHHPERSVVYVGTHDNDTAVGWWAAVGDDGRRDVSAAALRAGIGDEEPPERMLMRLALSSRARLAVLTAQDLLGLGSHARLNTPGTSQGNWTWRLRPGELTPELAAWLRTETARAGRLP
jgi:4-alpha-glucanotransferase